MCCCSAVNLFLNACLSATKQNGHINVTNFVISFRKHVYNHCLSFCLSHMPLCRNHPCLPVACLFNFFPFLMLLMCSFYRMPSVISSSRKLPPLLSLCHVFCMKADIAVKTAVNFRSWGEGCAVQHTTDCDYSFECAAVCFH